MPASLAEFTQKYTHEFFQDSDALHIERADVYPKATEHISDMIAMIQCLLDRGVAYASDDGIYFSIKKFPDYGKLAHLDLGGLKPGASGRILSDEYEKENVADFALWKFWDEQDGEARWKAPFGDGRPGWHIECSAMSQKHLGETFDIHTGGIDLLFPHHQDELAQSQACTGKPFVRLWLHAEHLLVDNKKMSKSLGNFYTLRDVLKRGIEPLALRYLFLSAHYRSKLNFTWESLAGAQSALNRLREVVRDFDQPAIECADEEKRFLDVLNQDLNTPQALAVLWKLLDEKTLASAAKARSILFFDRVLGLGLEQSVSKKISVPEKVQQLIGERELARKEKEWTRSDELRAEILSLGYEVDDTEDGAKIRKI